MSENNRFVIGLKSGLPIGLGYLSVAFTFGMMAVSGGLPIWTAVAISMSCLTSAGQFAGLQMMLAGSFAPIEMALTQLVINLRYALMSISLSQKVDDTVTLPHRLTISFFNTDEVFAVASMQKGQVGRRFMYGLATCPYVGWALGTLLGAVAGNILPESVRNALGLAIYAMFIAIVVPTAKKSRPVLVAALLAAAISCILRYVPLFSRIGSGFAVIICTVITAAVCAYFFPVTESDEEDV